MVKSKSGFTIVELLIVIVVIAILAAISIVAYSGIQVRARASALVSDLRATEKAFIALKATSGTESWWDDTDASLSGSGAGNPSITSIIAAQPDFRNIIKQAPSKGGFNTPNNWFYDNDSDTYNGCSASIAGASIAIYNPQNNAILQAVDDAIDDGNLACGKVRTSALYFVYGLN